jgi:hypothetical protein
MICTHHSSLLHMRFVDLHCTAVRVSTSWLLSQHSSRQSIATPLKFQSPCQSSCNSCWPAALAEVQRQMGPHSKNNNSWAVCNPAPGNTPQGLRSRQQHRQTFTKIVLAAACTALLLQQSASAFCTGCKNSSTASHRPCRRTRDEPSALLSRKSSCHLVWVKALSRRTPCRTGSTPSTTTQSANHKQQDTCSTTQMPHLAFVRKTALHVDRRLAYSMCCTH